MNGSKKDPALCRQIPSRFDFKQDLAAVGLGKILHQQGQILSEIRKVKSFLCLRIVRHAKAASKINKLEVRKIHGQREQRLNAIQIRLFL